MKGIPDIKRYKIQNVIFILAGNQDSPVFSFTEGRIPECCELLV